MKVEFTKTLANNNWDDIRIAINERADNLNIITEEQKSLIEKINTRPELVVRFEEFVLLKEMAAQTKKLWKPQEVLNVYFFGGTDERTKKVLKIASEWTKYSGIKFIETNLIEDAKIRIAFQSPSSWSYIGTDALGVPLKEPTMNFGWLTNDLDEKDYKQVVLHEFGHTLGLIHEHQSPIATVDWNKFYVYWYFRQFHGWTEEMVDTNIFQEFEKKTIKHSVLDKKSIMGYYIPPEFTNNNQSFPQNYELSDIDKEYIKELYPQMIKS